jgi:plastocyanin
MRLGVIALLAGVLAAALVAGFPAVAADQAVSAVSYTAWNPSQVNIDPGNKVTWSNSTGYMHNVCVAKPGDTPKSIATDPTGASCTEFRNGAPAADWSTYTNDHTFTTNGTYNFICQEHTGMKGTIQVGPGGGTTTTTTTTGTTTTTTTPTQTQTTTQTTPTQTTPAADTTAPSFTSAVKRKASRTSLILTFSASEDGTLKATVSRRAPGARSFRRVGRASVPVHKGRNTVKLPRRASGKLRRGSYRVTLVLVDAAGNVSSRRILKFKIA